LPQVQTERIVGAARFMLGFGDGRIVSGVRQEGWRNVVVRVRTAMKARRESQQFSVEGIPLARPSHVQWSCLSGTMGVNAIRDSFADVRPKWRTTVIARKDAIASASEAATA
jgi:hypothetical protein